MDNQRNGNRTYQYDDEENSEDKFVVKSIFPWLIVIGLLLGPLYLLGIILVIKSGIFRSGITANAKDQYLAVLTYATAAVGTAATVVGMLFTRAHNLRTLAFQRRTEQRKAEISREAEARLSLDTVVKGLELVTLGDTYAPSGRVAGALAALVHLGHPSIAMRSMHSAWQDDAIDAATACWLIDEVFRTGDDAARNEASRVLLSGASKLTSKRSFEWRWPLTYGTDWPQILPVSGRGRILFSIAEILASQSKSWWRQSYSGDWYVPILHAAMVSDDYPYLRDIACRMLDVFAHSSEFDRNTWLWNDSVLSIAEVRQNVAAHDYEHSLLSDQAERYVSKLSAWWDAGESEPDVRA